MTHHRFVLSALSILLAAAVASQIPAAEKPIKIGVQLPLSGERAPVGRIIRQGVEMAVEAVNRDGGVNGVPLAIIYEDDRNTQQGAVDAATKLIQDHRVVAIIGELFSPFVLASRERVEQAGVPFLTGATNPRITEGAKWIFRVGVSDALRADLFARYAVEHRKLERLAILHDRTGVHNARAEAIINVLRVKYSIVPVIRGNWKPGDQDFTSQLEQVKANPVQAIIALGEGAEGGAFLRQVKALGIHAMVIADRDFGTKTALQAAGHDADGVVILADYVPALHEPKRQAWARAYQERYGAEANVIAAQYHDAVLLLATAMKNGGTSREGIKAALERVKGFPGVMTDYTFDQQHNGVHRLYVVTIKGGVPTLEQLLEEER